jgi:hypothetical protein
VGNRSGGDNRAEPLIYQGWASLNPERHLSLLTVLLTRAWSGEHLKAISTVVATNSGLLTRPNFIEDKEAKTIALSIFGGACRPLKGNRLPTTAPN